jgi:hypothetical protein
VKCDDFSADVVQSQKQKTLASQEESLVQAVETAAESDKAKYVRWFLLETQLTGKDRNSKKGYSLRAKHRIS